VLERCTDANLKRGDAPALDAPHSPDLPVGSHLFESEIPALA